MRIAIDLLGSESSPEELLSGVIRALPTLPESLSITLIGNGVEELTSTLGAKVELLQVSAFIGVSEEPLVAIRQKTESSLRIAIEGLAKGRWDAVITSGNSGALVAAATIWLPKAGLIRRPAMGALLPTGESHCLLLDVGALPHPDEKHLEQLAIQGAVWWEALAERSALPRVGILNIGEEGYKGTALLRKLYLALQADRYKSQFTFIGNVEGRFLSQEMADVVVTDGFTGNVFLKAVEGAYLRFISDLASVASSVSSAFLEGLQARYDYQNHPGAFLIGTDALVFKCHGVGSASSQCATLSFVAKLLDEGRFQKVRSRLEQVTSPHVDK